MEQPVEEMLSDVIKEVWESAISYSTLAPLLEYIYSEIWSLEEQGVNTEGVLESFSELDEFLYERLDI